VLAIVVVSGIVVVDSETFVIVVGFGTVAVDSADEVFAAVVDFGVLAIVVVSGIVVVDSDDEVFVVVVVFDSGTFVVISRVVVELIDAVSIDCSVIFLTSVGDEIVVDSPRVFIEKLNKSDTTKLKKYLSIIL
jgi:hypothetical protein